MVRVDTEYCTGPLASSINVRLPNNKFLEGVLCHMLPDADFNNVNDSLEKLPGLLAYVLIMYADACYYYDLAKRNTTVVRAQAELQIRREAEHKPTVNEVNALVELDGEVQAATSREFIAKHNRDVLKAATESITRTLESYKEISYNTRQESRL